MFRMVLLIVALLLGCGGKPAPAPSNVGGGGPLPKEVESTKPDVCAAQKTCVACLSSSTDDPNRGSCDWDVDRQTCQITCGPEAKNCLLVGAKNIGEQRASELCAGARPSQPQP